MVTTEQFLKRKLASNFTKLVITDFIRDSKADGVCVIINLQSTLLQIKPSLLMNANNGDEKLSFLYFQSVLRNIFRLFLYLY